MRWSFFSSREPLDAAERFRLEHEVWLSAALASGRPMPRIPLRREDRGGFDAMRRRPGGRARAERWWTLALERVDGLSGEF